MKRKVKFLLLMLFFAAFNACTTTQQKPRVVRNFDDHWRFHLGDLTDAQTPAYQDASWQLLDVPHDWSIGLAFDKNSPAGPGGGYLNGGIGWYRKTFTPDKSLKGKQVFIDFDGIYRDSKVWINGHLLGYRPNGYISFQYDLTPYLNWDKPNVIAVRVDNSQQPNSRWYSGSGIYRDVRLVYLNPDHFAHWGIYVTTPDVKSTAATVKAQFQTVLHAGADATIKAQLFDAAGKLVAQSVFPVEGGTAYTTLELKNPHLWSPDDPYLYKLVSSLKVGNKVTDRESTNVGIRYFRFDPKEGFFLNGKHLKILGTCNHYDLGCLGTAFNKSALEYRFQLLKDMGCNALRTSHNPPDPEFLDLADRMGFLVMDEAFDMWNIPKIKYDYSQYFSQWHKRDLSDQVRRDRNHPSVIIWSVGNEIPNQHAKTKAEIHQADSIMESLCALVRSLDNTRPISTANDDPEPSNPLINCGATDLIGINYHNANLVSFPKVYPGKSVIQTEAASAFETRGYYTMPSDSLTIEPKDWRVPFHTDNNFCSSYDNWRAPWGSTHEADWKVVKENPYVSGMFVWTGFDYIGEPTPFLWPSRSSYFGILDLANFPKDIYYMYQSEWTKDTVLHIFPHWNWKPGQRVDIWAYYNNADSVQLFLNGKPMGVRHKKAGEFHVMWRLHFEPGTLRAVSYKDGKEIKVVEERTAGPAAQMALSSNHTELSADNKDIAFVTVRITDKDGNLVPDAANRVQFNVTGPGRIVGVANGDETSHHSFKAHHCNAFFGKCMVAIESTNRKGTIRLTATTEGLPDATLDIPAR